MKKFVYSKNNSIYANLISIFIIFFIFTVLSLVLIIIAADMYKKMKNEVDTTFNTTALISYVSNKVKNFDSIENKIFIENVNDQLEVLGIEDNNEKLVTYIYEKENVVYENIQKKGTELDVTTGQVLFEAKEINFEKYSNSLIKIRVKALNGEEINNYVKLMSGMTIKE